MVRVKHVAFAYTRGMTADEVEARLLAAEAGVLALADGGDAYAFPVAHYYDGSRLYFRLGIADAGRKQAFLESTETACYVVYGADPTTDARELDSWSIVITGALTRIPREEHGRFDTAEINRRFTPIRVFSEAIDDVEVVIKELVIETMTGRITPTQ